MRILNTLAVLALATVAAQFGFSASAAAQCTNTCSTANDGECDDGGPNSLYSICDLGTDCNDCGPRSSVTLCTNTCSTANDQECDDGGTGSLYSICDLGTDCNDCGPRVVQAGAQAQYQHAAPGSLCTNTCSTANDQECDDGGPGSMYSICDFGTDCNDCGPRTNTVPQNAAPQNGICTNTCGTSGDNECDDGGPNSLYDICNYGTDCSDCGARPPIAGCSNTCSTSNDGECDDGGPASLYSICDLGTDCSDCGPR